MEKLPDIPRRGFVALGAAYAAALGASVFKPDNDFIYMDDPEKLTQALNPVLSRHHIPENLDNQVLWGYKAYNGEKDTILHRRTVVFAGLVQEVLDNQNYFDTCTQPEDHAFLPVEMGFSGVSIHTVRARDDILHIQDWAKQTAQYLQNLDPYQRFETTRQILANSFRTILYKQDSPESNFPQTLGQFLTNSSGGCEDFAIGRYMLARTLGTPAEDLMVIMYRNRENMKSIGHANLALYDRTHSEWNFIDGTGRRPNQRRGRAIHFTNTREAFDALRAINLTDMPSLAPVMGINSNGIVIFRAMESYTPPSQFSFYAPLDLPQARLSAGPHAVFYESEARRALFARRPA